MVFFQSWCICQIFAYTKLLEELELGAYVFHLLLDFIICVIQISMQNPSCFSVNQNISFLRES